MSGNKIWYHIDNYPPYPVPEGIVVIDSIDKLEANKKLVLKSIDLFNANVDYDDMWNMFEASKRVQRGEKLFLSTTKEEYSWRNKQLTKVVPLGFVWFKKNYLYNMFMHSSRPEGHTVKFVRACFNLVFYRTISLYCDDWNIRAQKMFEKVGFERVKTVA